jgi:hypothetical protein
MEINDSILAHVCEYLRSKKMNFQMIKLVKNLISDEGMGLLLGYLLNNEVTQVLNLTSNQLTSKCLDGIL